MDTLDMDKEFTDSVRADLVAIGTKSSRLQRMQRGRRGLAIGVVVLAAAIATTGAAAVVSSIPGTTTMTGVGGTVSATHTGTGTIDLGPAPAGVANVILDVTCISDTGKITVDDDQKGQFGLGTAEWNCAETKRTVHIADGRMPEPGTTTVTITADPGTTWKATARYATRSSTAWGVNASGQTYGVCTDGTCPDLQSAQATNGAIGYVSSKEQLNFGPCSGYLDVYESDGTTVIGKFPIGMDNGTPYAYATENGTPIPACINPSHAK